MTFSPILRGMELPIGTRPDINMQSFVSAPVQHEEVPSESAPIDIPRVRAESIATNPQPLHTTVDIPVAEQSRMIVDSQPVNTFDSVAIDVTRQWPAIPLRMLGGIAFGIVVTGAGVFAVANHDSNTAEAPGVAGAPNASEKRSGDSKAGQVADATVEIPPFIVVDSDGCKKVVKATVPPLTYQGSGKAKVGQETVEDQMYTVTGKTSTFSISTCGLAEMPVAGNQSQPGITTTAMIDISPAIAVVRPKGEAIEPKVVAETTQTTLTEFGYGDPKALCNFAVNVVGCDEQVKILPETLQHENTAYTALAANLALKQCGAEAYNATKKVIIGATTIQDTPGIQYEITGLSESDYINNGTAAIADASVVSIDEMNQKAPESVPDINCKVMD